MSGTAFCWFTLLMLSLIAFSPSIMARIELRPTARNHYLLVVVIAVAMFASAVLVSFFEWMAGA